jgi:hypothetical protein
MTEPLTSERPKRLSLSAILEMMLTRPSSERSAVTLSRNSSGETLIEVTVRTGDDGDVLTAEDAERKAQEVYDRLRASYPAQDGHDNAEVALTRNAKGETQIAIEMKTSAAGESSLDTTATRTREAYDALRMKYPMADGFSAKPGSVKA